MRDDLSGGVVILDVFPGVDNFTGGTRLQGGGGVGGRWKTSVCLGLEKPFLAPADVDEISFDGTAGGRAEVFLCAPCCQNVLTDQW